MTHRTRIALTAIVLIVFGVAALGVCIHRDTAEPSASVPPVLRFDDGGLRYTYHVPTGDEGLFDPAADPKMLKNLRGARPDDLRRLREKLRGKLKEKFGVESFEELRRTQQDVIDRMRGLGYF